jgi:hypothetical protein
MEQDEVDIGKNLIHTASKESHGYMQFTKIFTQNLET